MEEQLEDEYSEKTAAVKVSGRAAGSEQRGPQLTSQEEGGRGGGGGGELTQIMSIPRRQRR